MNLAKYSLDNTKIVYFFLAVLLTLSGNIAVAADGKIELIDSFLQGWRDSADEMIDGVCDIAAGTISWQIVYSDMDFYVKMTKN